MEEIQVIVEFTSISRMLTGQTESLLKVRPGTTYADIISLLGQQFPALVGQIIDKNRNSFIPSNLFSLNGQKILQESDMNLSPKNGERLILVSLLAGG